MTLPVLRIIIKVAHHALHLAMTPLPKICTNIKGVSARSGARQRAVSNFVRLSGALGASLKLKLNVIKSAVEKNGH